MRALLAVLTTLGRTIGLDLLRESLFACELYLWRPTWFAVRHEVYCATKWYQLRGRVCGCAIPVISSPLGDALYRRRAEPNSELNAPEIAGPLPPNNRPFVPCSRQTLLVSVKRFCTLIACHCSPHPVRIPQAFSASAIARGVVTPPACIWRTNGSTFAAKASAATRIAVAPLALASF